MKNTAVRRRMEILLVEDNLEDARSTLETLEHEEINCRVSLVRDGEEAMQFLNHEGVFAQAPRPDLILLDMELPKKDGRQVLAEIRGHCEPELAAVPVIVLTGSLVHRAVLAAQDLHVEGYMTKPVSPSQFATVVRSLRQTWLYESLLREQ